MVEPVPARRVQGGGDEGHPRQRPRFGLDVFARQQFGVRKAPGEIEQDRRDLGQRAAVDDEGRDLAFGVEREIAGRSFFLNDIGLPSKATPISCSAMCTAIELAPGAKYRVSMRSSLHVIASEAKQSISPRKERMDCFVANAPRNDDSAY